ncbi:hypothetical protein [Pantoea sp. 9140]|uniref:hypothetical protein n=1 Tax=Pantoea sp. 9140 TaxID=1500896 RepID=UPI0005355EFB|nr:hypothetical protein [Pantoea sp. 9140]
MELKGLSPFIIRGFITENSSRFIGFCKDEAMSEEDFIKLLEDVDFNEIVTPELLAKFRL